MLGLDSVTNLTVLVLVVALPGLLAAAAAGLRGWVLAAAAPLVTFGLVGIAGTVLPLLGVSWSPAVLAGLSALVAAATLGARWGLAWWRPVAVTGPDRPGWGPLHHLGVAAAVVVSAGVGLAVVVSATAEFTALPQLWDTTFHANAIRLISSTGESAPVALAALNEPAGGGFYYPNAFHVVGATLVMATGVEVVPAMEMTIALVPALFALGVAALVRTVSGRPAVAAAGALLACTFSAFPYDLAGVLLPYIFALALLPAFATQWADALRLGCSAPYARPVVLGVGAVGLLALHPSGVVAAALLCGAYLVQAWWVRGPTGRDGVVIGVGALATGLLGAPLVLASAGAAASGSFDWPIAMSAGDAVGRLLTLEHGHDTPQWWTALAVALGLIGLRRHPELRWLAVSGAVFAVIYVLAVAYEGSVVELLSRPWWNDRWRLVALWAVAVAPLAGAGVVVVRDVLLDRLRRIGPLDRARPLVAVGLLAALLLSFGAVSEGFYRDRNTERLAGAFTDGPTVSYAERDAFRQLAAALPPDALVMNDPQDGSALAYALDGVRTVFASPVNEQSDLPTMSPDRRVLFDGFDDLDRDPAVQDAVRRLGITHVVVSSGYYGAAGGPAPGMREVERVAALALMFRTPSTAVYEVRLPDGAVRG